MKPNKKNKTPIIIVFVILYVLLLFVAVQASMVALSEPGITPITAIFEGLERIQKSPFDVSFNAYSQQYIGVVTIMFVLLLLVFYVESEKNNTVSKKNEAGSAGWNDFKDYDKKYSDPPNKKKKNGPSNMILSEEVFLNMNTRETLRNNNILVIGGSGSGKSRFFCKPNILQANSSFVITDPSGELLESQATFLKKEGYCIKVFNLVDMVKSNCYNPFNYIRDDLGVLTMINCLIKNTNPDGKGGGDPFWEKTETALLQALVFYLVKYRPKSEQNFTSVMKLLRAAEVDENNPNTKSQLDKMFDEVALKDPNSIALKQYQTFKMGAGKTLKSILISCSVRLTVFNMKEIENLTGTDDIDLGSVGDKKTALFIVIPVADDTFNFLVSMVYSQLFETLYFHAETECPGKRLPVHVRFIADEFANIGQIPEFTKKLATMRKKEISCSIILQNLAQIKNLYKDDWGSIVGNCDTFIFLGGQEYDTLEYVSKLLGKMTLIVKNNSRSKGKKGNSSESSNKTGRELMTPDEIMRMDNSNCIVIIRGLKPFFCKKFDYTKHKNYKFTADFDKKFLYMIEDKITKGAKLRALKELEANLRKVEGEEYISVPKLIPIT